MNQEMLDLIKENLKDPSVFEKISKSVLWQAKKTAIVLGSFLIVALLAIVYAFVQQVKTQKVSQDLALQIEEVRLMKSQSEMQAALALEARLIAEEANKMALEQLSECLQKKN